MDFYMILSCLIDSNIMVVLYIAVRFFKALYLGWFMRKSWWQQFWPTPQLSEPSMKKEARSFLSPARIGQTIVPTLVLWRYRPHFHPLKPSCLLSSVEWFPHWCPHSHQSRRRIGKCGKSVRLYIDLICLLVSKRFVAYDDRFENRHIKTIPSVP